MEYLPEAGLELREKVDQAIPRFVEAMDDDFNSALALGVLFEMIRATNRFLAETKDVGPVAMMLLAQVRHLFAETGGVLGLFGNRPAQWLEGIKSAKAGQIDISPADIEKLIIERSEARKARNFKRGDEIRDMLLEKGIQLLDSAQGTTWNVK
jgi:cysteinyl-tRNA synthetase